MKRLLLLTGFGILLLSVFPALGGPTRGPYRTTGEWHPGRTCEYRETFRANERACVIIEGDHKPTMNLKARVLDPSGNTVASDVAGGDLVAVIWYPRRTQEYRIIVSGDGAIYNELTLHIK